MQMRIANNKGIGTTKKQAKPITHDQERKDFDMHMRIAEY